MTTVDEWHDWRSQGIGASDIPAILGVSSFASPWSLWAEKTGRTSRTGTTQRQRIGQVLEGAIAQLFHEETGYHVAGEQTWCTHPHHKWAKATVDGFVVPATPGANTLDDALGVLEIKTDGAPGWYDGVPPRVWTQVQWQMFVTGTDRAWVAVLHSGFTFQVHEVGRDDTAIADMLDRAQRFWFDHVQGDQPPPVDNADATRDAIASVWPDHETGKAVSLDDLVDVIEHRDVLKAEIKAGEKALALAENAIKEAMADAEVGTIRGIPVLTCKTQTRAGIDTKALRVAHPDIAAEFETTSTYRVLRAVNQKLRNRAA
jgi:putative phage-type endonuclease